MKLGRGKTFFCADLFPPIPIPGSHPYTHTHSGTPTRFFLLIFPAQTFGLGAFGQLVECSDPVVPSIYPAHPMGAGCVSFVGQVLACGCLCSFCICLELGQSCANPAPYHLAENKRVSIEAAAKCCKFLERDGKFK